MNAAVHSVTTDCHQDAEQLETGMKLKLLVKLMKLLVKLLMKLLVGEADLKLIPGSLESIRMMDL